MEVAKKALEVADRITKVAEMALEAVGKALGEQNGNKKEENEGNGKISSWWNYRSSSSEGPLSKE